jgi:hypothetical protein
LCTVVLDLGVPHRSSALAMADEGSPLASAAAISGSSPRRKFELGNTPITHGLDAARREALTTGRHRHYDFPRKRALFAALLLCAGLAMAITGLLLTSVVMGVVGGLALLPGAYMSFVYTQLWRGHPAYRIEEWGQAVDDDDM